MSLIARCRGLVERKKQAPAAPGDERHSIPCARRPNNEAAQKYARSCPGSVAGLGTARRYHFAIVCTLVGLYHLDGPQALELLQDWGEQASNTYANGRYYPWETREHLASINQALRLRRTGKLKITIKGGKFQECRRRAQEIYDRLKDELPQRTHGDKSHPTGYRLREEDWVEIGAQVLYLAPGDEGQNGTNRQRAYYQSRGLKRAWVHNRYMVVRNTYSDLGFLNAEDETYLPPWAEEPGHCCRWRSNLQLVDRYLAEPPPSLLNHYSQSVGTGWRPVKEWRFESPSTRYGAAIKEFFDDPEAYLRKAG
jgi:hypothetical protein